MENIPCQSALFIFGLPPFENVGFLRERCVKKYHSRPFFQRPDFSRYPIESQQQSAYPGIPWAFPMLSALPE